MEKDFLRFEPVTSRFRSSIYGSIYVAKSKFIFFHLKLTSKHQITQQLMPISFAVTSINYFFQMKNFLWNLLIFEIDKFLEIRTVPRAQKKKTNALQVPLPRRLSLPCVSDLQLI
jgi:hypothetical protein